MMDIHRVFQRLPTDLLHGSEEESGGYVDEWKMRMDNLLMSDPQELISFISDGIVALAAQVKPEYEEESWSTVLEVIDEVSDVEERASVIESTRGRFMQLVTHYEEHTDRPAAEIMTVIHNVSRDAPWPPDKEEWMYLSFADTTKDEWIGAAIVPGNSPGAAMRGAAVIGAERGFGGHIEVAAREFTAEVLAGSFPEEMRNRLLTREEIEENGYELAPLPDEPTEFVERIEQFLAEQDS